MTVDPTVKTSESRRNEDCDPFQVSSSVGKFPKKRNTLTYGKKNNKTKKLDTNNGESDNENIRKGLLRPGTSPVIPHFSNTIK